jgi:hypothetical protein
MKRLKLDDHTLKLKEPNTFELVQTEIEVERQKQRELENLICNSSLRK